jgi:hypothetical protein
MNKKFKYITIDPMNEIMLGDNPLLPNAPEISYASFRGGVYKKVQIKNAHGYPRSFDRYFDFNAESSIFNEPVCMQRMMSNPSDVGEMRRIEADEFYAEAARILKFQYALAFFSRKYLDYESPNSQERATFKKLIASRGYGISGFIKYVRARHGMKIDEEIAYHILGEIIDKASMPESSYDEFREAISKQFAWYKLKSGAARNELHSLQGRILDGIIAKEREATGRLPRLLSASESIIGEAVARREKLLRLKKSNDKRR